MKVDANERAVNARKLFENGYNCSQAVAMAYADVVGADLKTIENLAIAFGGGLGRQREVCGTVSGGSMIMGAYVAENMPEAKVTSYKLIQDFCGRFRQQNGSIICRELLALAKGENDNPEPTPRTKEYYTRRPCAQYVEISARTLGEMINQL